MDSKRKCEALGPGRQPLPIGREGGGVIFQRTRNARLRRPSFGEFGAGPEDKAPLLEKEAPL